MSDNTNPPTYPPQAPAAAYAPPAQPTQAYPGAAPSYNPPAQYPAYGAAQPAYGAPGQVPAGYPAYGAAGYAAPPVARPTSGLAITSLVCGIVGIVFSWLVVPILASIAAVITGHLALKQTKLNPGIGGRGMAIAGLIMGYVVAAIGVLGLLLFFFAFAVWGSFAVPLIFSS